MEAKKRSMQILKAVIIFIMCLTVAVPTISVVPGMSVTASAATSIKTPALKKVTALNYYSLQVEWSAVKGVTGYAVYRKSGSSGYKRIATLTGSTKCKYVDEKAATGTEYTYTVRAYIKKGSNVTWSSYVKNGIKGKTSLSKPAIKSIADGKSKQLTVNWGKVAGATGYMLYRSTSQNGKYTLLKTITKNATVSYTDTKLTNGKTYYYKIKAYRTVNNKKVYSAYSSVKSKKVTVNVRNADTADEFYKAAAKVNKDNPVKASGAMSGDEFFAKRLIIKGKNSKLNFDKYKPTSVVKSPDNYYIVQFASSSAAKKAFQAISNWSSVDFVEPDSYIGVDAADSSEAVQATASESKSWGVSAMGADKYASYVSKTANNEIKVAVVDTGVSNHTFLNGRIASGGYDFVDNDSNPADLHGHGTHVSGTIVDCTPGLKVKVLPVRVLDADGSGSSLNVGNAIKYAADHGAKVINLSLGGGHSNYEDDCISYAIKKGVTVVVAAGNENQNTANVCPAHIKNAIVVAAVDSKLKKAYFSNYGSSVDVAAPGVDILSCLPGGRYARWNGTSMATPHIAAVAAMYKLVYPSKTPAEIEKLVKTNVKDLGASGWDKYFGNGFPKLKVPSSGTISPTGITLSASSATLTVGNTKKLTATVSPSNATNKTVTWSSSNTSVASVSGGTVTAKSAGTATITAKTSNGKTATCKITVNATTVSPTGITLSASSATLTVGSTKKLTATVSPSNATNKTVTWSSSNTSVASVSGGTVTAKSVGTATITAKTSNGKTATCKITVKAVLPTGITLSASSATLEIGSTKKLTATVSPSNATNKTVTWSSSNTSVASVSGGTVTAKSVGTATITAKTSNGKTATCKITVKNKTIIESVSLSEYSSSAAITENGDLYMWGNNFSGNLGNGTHTDSSTPIKIMSNVKTVCLGKGAASGAITNNGDLYMWGNNYYGNVGDGTDGRENNYRTKPVKIMSNVKSLSLGDHSSAAITENGDLYMWGNDYIFEDPDTGTKQNVTKPTKVMSNIKSVSLGYSIGAVITEEGDLYVWGQSDTGLLGDGGKTDLWGKSKIINPVKIMSNVKAVSVQGYSSYVRGAAITNSGDLYTWGCNWDGALGDGTTTNRRTPKKIMSNVKDVSLGNGHSAAITNSGDLYTWGSNRNGQLGDGTISDRSTPKKIMSNVKAVSLGDDHSAAITNSGDLYLWGENGCGQIGNGTVLKDTFDHEGVYTPTKIIVG